MKSAVFCLLGLFGLASGIIFMDWDGLTGGSRCGRISSQYGHQSVFIHVDLKTYAQRVGRNLSDWSTASKPFTFTMTVSGLTFDEQTYPVNHGFNNGTFCRNSNCRATTSYIENPTAEFHTFRIYNPNLSVFQNAVGAISVIFRMVGNNGDIILAVHTANCTASTKSLSIHSNQTCVLCGDPPAPAFLDRGCISFQVNNDLGLVSRDPAWSFSITVPQCILKPLNGRNVTMLNQVQPILSYDDIPIDSSKLSVIGNTYTWTNALDFSVMNFSAGNHTFKFCNVRLPHTVFQTYRMNIFLDTPSNLPINVLNMTWNPKTSNAPRWMNGFSQWVQNTTTVDQMTKLTRHFWTLLNPLNWNDTFSVNISIPTGLISNAIMNVTVQSDYPNLEGGPTKYSHLVSMSNFFVVIPVGRLQVEARLGITIFIDGVLNAGSSSSHRWFIQFFDTMFRPLSQNMWMDQIVSV